MRVRTSPLAAFIAAASITTGCVTVEQPPPEEHRGALSGAGVGAATGAIAGAIIGKNTESAVIGGLVGALVGGAIGHYRYDRELNADETARRYGYHSDRGTELAIEDVSASPRRASPGEDVDIRMTYAVLTPDPDGETRVTEVREIRYGGRIVGSPEVRISRTPGTYTSDIPIRLPPDAAPGEYEVRTLVLAGDARDSRGTTFQVR